MPITNNNIAPSLDFANHHPESTGKDIQILCQKVLQYGFNSAFVNPCWVRLAKQIIGLKARVGSIIAFPLGQEKTWTKISHCVSLIGDGVDELDISTNVGLLKSSQAPAYLQELKEITHNIKKINKSVIVKFIMETGLLTEEEIKQAALLILQSGADFIKTCSGMGPRGATVADVQIIKSVVGNKIKIKVAGGIGNYQQAMEFITAGASRIGTSKAVEIVTQVPAI